MEQDVLELEETDQDEGDFAVDEQPAPLAIPSTPQAQLALAGDQCRNPQEVPLHFQVARARRSSMLPATALTISRNVQGCLVRMSRYYTRTKPQ